MPDTNRPNQPISAHDALPPVEPPSAGFILQLFIVPGIIVAIIVMVWLLFNWVARTGNDPQEYVKALRRNNANRWQAAFNLANAMGARDDAGQAMRQDAHLASELAAILDEEMQTGSTQKKEPITLRVYVCQALGQFSVPDGLPVLLRAASTQRSDEEIEVRLAALRAIALLDQNVRESGDDAAFRQPDVVEKLLAAARDTDPRIRSAAAFALGVIGGDEYIDRLAGMLADSSPDVRYNAATWLASRGDTRAIPVLVEMLDPDELEAGVVAEQQTASRPYKRALIVSNALRAAGRLAEQNHQADIVPIEQAIDRLLAKPLADQLKVQASETLKQLKSERPKSSAAN
jgi:HEAT repeat protein